MQVWNVLHAARCKYRTQNWCKKSPSAHHRTTLSGYIFATKAHIDNRKKLVKQQYLPHMSLQYGELLPMGVINVFINQSVYCLMCLTLSITEIYMVPTPKTERGSHDNDHAFFWGNSPSTATRSLSTKYKVPIFTNSRHTDSITKLGMGHDPDHACSLVG